MITLSYDEFIQHAKGRGIEDRIVSIPNGLDRLLVLFDNGLELRALLPFSSEPTSPYQVFTTTLDPFLKAEALYEALQRDRIARSVDAINTRLRPDQVFIERWGALTVVSGADQLFTNAAPIPSGYTAHKIEYIVPAGRVFYLKGWRIALDAPNNSVNVMTAIETGDGKKIRMSLNTNSPSQGAEFNPGIPIPAGTAVRVWAHASSGSTVTFVRFAGVEEPA